MALTCHRRTPQWSILFLLLCASALTSCGATPTPPAPTLLPRPTQAAHPYYAALKTLDGVFTITLTITPSLSGANDFMVHVVDNHSHRLAVRARVTLYTTMQDMQMGTDSIPLKADGRGLFSAKGDNLSMSGRWAIGITIQLADHSIHKAGVSLEIPS